MLFSLRKCRNRRLLINALLNPHATGKKGPTLMPSMTQRQWLQFSFGVDYCRVGFSVEHVGLTPTLRPVILCSGRNRHSPYLAFREVSVLLAMLACCLLGGPVFVGFISFSLLFSFLFFFLFPAQECWSQPVL